MLCPACGHSLTETQAGSIVVDACAQGCGGLWFDAFELKKVDEAHEAAGEALLAIRPAAERAAIQDEKRRCPKCVDVVMFKHFASVQRRVTVDECAGCGGFWLDAGELDQIRGEFESEAEKDRITETALTGQLESAAVGAIVDREENLARAQQVARMFRLICPSNYVPGKQDWGAF
ncbi:zf-TFIIB domain-containing protein [bacterium]|nr:zf-TFIIB domain-containing protein [bacterium]